MRGLASAQDVDEFAVGFFLLNQLIAGLFGKGLKVAHRARVGSDDFEQLAAVHASQGFFSFENRQRAVQSPCVYFFRDVHGLSGVVELVGVGLCWVWALLPEEVDKFRVITAQTQPLRQGIAGACRPALDTRRLK